VSGRRVVLAAGTVGGAGTTVALRAALAHLDAAEAELVAVVPNGFDTGPGRRPTGRTPALLAEALGRPDGDVYVGFADRLPLVRRAAPIQVLVVQNPHLYGPAPADWGVALRAKRAFLRWWARRSVGRADLIVCSTAASRVDLLAATSADAARVVVRPVPPPDVGAPKAVHRDRVERVLVVGDVYGYKRTEVAVDAVAAFARSVGRPVELVHLGKVREPEAGAALDAAADRAAAAGVAVVRRGAVPHEEVLDAMRRADVLLLCSEAETQGLPLAEAMAMGLPVVCRALDVFAEQASAAAQLVERHGDAAAFAAALAAVDAVAVRTAMADRGRRAIGEPGAGWNLLP